MTQEFTYNPDEYLTSAIRSLIEYVKEGLELTGDDDDPYTVESAYPDAEGIGKSRVPLAKTMIHFEIDEINGITFGLGDCVVDDDVREIVGSDPPQDEVLRMEAKRFDITLDMGIWASVESGGPTARMQARQDLDTLLSGTGAYEACHAATDGVELLSFTGGRNVTDSINDVPIFRTVDMALRIRVFARQNLVAVPVIEGVTQLPEIVIDDETIVG